MQSTLSKKKTVVPSAASWWQNAVMSIQFDSSYDPMTVLFPLHQ